MVLALLAATDDELLPLRAALAGGQLQHHAGREFHAGRLDGRDVVLALAGAGPVAAATTATLLIERYGAEAIVCSGPACGLAPGVRRGDLLVARALLEPDDEAAPLFARHPPPPGGRNRYATDAPLSDALLAAARAAIEAERIGRAGSLEALGIAAPQVHEGLLLSGSGAAVQASAGAALRAALPEALALETDGAAVAQVCHDCDLPFAVLRCVAGRTDDPAPADGQRYRAEVAAPLAASALRCWLRSRAAA